MVTQSRALENAADWCVSNDLVAKLAMVMENRELASLIQELVGHEGQQLYVHPASRYVRAGGCGSGTSCSACASAGRSPSGKCVRACVRE